MITSLKVNSHDVLPYVKQDGIEYQYVKKLGPNQGEAINGGDILDIKARKENLVITFRDLTDDEQELIQSYLVNDTVQVEYYSKAKRQTRTDTFWLQELSCGSKASYPDGSAIWSGMKVQFNMKNPL